ncbi:uncharacterized protein LOC122502669 [Leptopilina heterotoma]|uniref:uncharacterized protein LOC122502669 n=1 Tax=Leptopilina heterotoma TaxID=63436 RepID=UPI001CA7FFB2|nr:uncharacterized protein LOC122502669 [Leptopilina heterotoma]
MIYVYILLCALIAQFTYTNQNKKFDEICEEHGLEFFGEYNDGCIIICDTNKFFDKKDHSENVILEQGSPCSIGYCDDMGNCMYAPIRTTEETTNSPVNLTSVSYTTTDKSTNYENCEGELCKKNVANTSNTMDIIFSFTGKLGTFIKNGIIMLLKKVLSILE